MDKEDEAGCCARHGTLAPGLESRAPRARRCIASFTSQPLFYPFFFLPLLLIASCSRTSELGPVYAASGRTPDDGEPPSQRLQCCEVTVRSIRALPTDANSLPLILSLSLSLAPLNRVPFPVTGRLRASVRSNAAYADLQVRLVQGRILTSSAMSFWKLDEILGKWEVGREAGRLIY